MSGDLKHEERRHRGRFALVVVPSSLALAGLFIALMGPAQGGAPTEDDMTAPAAVVAAFNNGGCGNCHTIPGVPGATGTVGPDLTEIGAVAGDRNPPQTSEEYITESILDPAAFIAPECPGGECPEGVMLQTFGETLSDDELAAIVAYLSVLGTDEAVDLELDSASVEPLDLSLPPESSVEPFAPLDEGDDAPSDEQIALGKYLFFDERLSASVSLSCASCHDPELAFTDGQALSDGFPSTAYFRNTPTLYDTAYAERLYWDGRMDGGDMPTTVRDHIAEAHFMSMDGRLMVERINQIPAYVDAFQTAFESEPGYGKVLNAVAAYVRSLKTGPTPADDGTLSAEAQAGQALFEGQAGCALCHNGPTLSNFEFANTGAESSFVGFEPERTVTLRRFFRTLGTPNYAALETDPGSFVLSLDEADRGAFRVPPLREVANSAPYMHGGTIETLEDVVRFYNDGGGATQTAGLSPLGLSDEQVAQVVAYLESLSSDLVAVEAPALPDYGVVPLGGG